MTAPIKFGEGDGTLQAVGGMEGLTKLVHAFYRIMASNEDYRPLFDMHPQPIDTSIDKLILFLHGWMGGEKMYAKKYGQIALPRAHAHLHVDDSNRMMWLNCMSDALQECGYSADLREYLITQLSVPAGRIQQVSEMMRGNEA
ncbi:group II truncated hemoglobin [Maribrevibacterium harenarium]|uniref:Group II truncated hemoglobin n=1 Tax=Maribrevibacterium harenarium TaxID=2589817 RepID=A0A501X4D2_9GAMM|nr:group II truncated hemoglobin [Maribrevibacterium harenarium]TPE55277.1 group II truncated hemoglobin [Maribrevibacterium harenarium]